MHPAPGVFARTRLADISFGAASPLPQEKAIRWFRATFGQRSGFRLNWK
jgi:hypothetical protein